MYAGRYLWWSLVALFCYAFFAIFFVYLAWLGIRMSGCAAVAGSCGALEGLLLERIRPSGLFISGIFLLTSTVLRLHYLKLNLLWSLALFVWFGASASYFFSLGNYWFANLSASDMLRLMPLSVPFLLALVAFLCFPLEIWKDRQPAGSGLSILAIIAGFAAAYSFSFTIANSVELPKLVGGISGSETAVALTMAAQATLRKLVLLGQAGIAPMLVALAVFTGTLGIALLLRRMPSVA